MRFLSAAMVGVLIPLFALAAPALTITMEPAYPDQGPIRPAVTVSGATGTNPRLEFRRYLGTTCSNNSTLTTLTISGNGTFTGPDLQPGNTGAYSLRVRFVSSTSSVYSGCVSFLVRRTVTATTTLPKAIYDNNDRLEPVMELANTTADAGGQVEITRWAGSGCGPGKSVSVGVLPVAGGKPQGKVNLQDGAMGPHSFRVTYSGDTKNGPAASACADYTIGVYIRGRVFQDNDGSGTVDPGEEGLAGAVVTVRKGQSIVGSATTSGSGLYEILVISTGTFTVSLKPPEGYEDTGATEFTVQVSGNSVNERNFGVAQVPSTLLARPTGSVDDPPAADRPSVGLPSEAGFTVLSFAALGLVALAAVAMLVLVFALRNRQENS